MPVLAFSVNRLLRIAQTLRKLLFSGFANPGISAKWLYDVIKKLFFFIDVIISVGYRVISYQAYYREKR